MPKSARLRFDDRDAIAKLIGECRDLGDDRNRWRERWVAGLATLVGADLGHAGEMAGCRALQPRDLGVVCWGPQEGFVNSSSIDSQLAEFRGDPTYSPAMIEHLRRHAVEDGVCHSRSRLIENEPWYSSFDYNVIQRQFNVDHVCWCFRSIPKACADECSGVILNREKGRSDFSARDLAVVQECHMAISLLIGGALARFSDPSPLDLAPRIREVLHCLLEGDSDKQTAARLRLSRYTVNQYTKTIYRHFKVQGRAELLARWIRRAWGDQFFWLAAATSPIPPPPPPHGDRGPACPDRAIRHAAPKRGDAGRIPRSPDSSM